MKSKLGFWLLVLVVLNGACYLFGLDFGMIALANAVLAALIGIMAVFAAIAGCFRGKRTGMGDEGSGGAGTGSGSSWLSGDSGDGFGGGGGGGGGSSRSWDSDSGSGDAGGDSGGGDSGGSGD